MNRKQLVGFFLNFTTLLNITAAVSLEMHSLALNLLKWASNSTSSYVAGSLTVSISKTIKQVELLKHSGVHFLN